MPIDEALATAIREVRESLHRPENVERAFFQFVITEVVTRLMMNDALAGAIAQELPRVTTVAGPEKKDDDGTSMICHTTHLTLFGHEIFSYESCTTGAGTGSGHAEITLPH